MMFQHSIPPMTKHTTIITSTAPMTQQLMKIDDTKNISNNEYINEHNKWVIGSMDIIGLYIEAKPERVGQET